jgi:cytidylate kinase
LKGPVITVSGPHGTGKSTYARALAADLGLRYVCAGELFRDLARERGMSLEAFSKYAACNPEVDHLIDERTRAEAKTGGVVIDAQLAAWMVRDQADVKLLLVASDKVRFSRIAKRDHVTFEFAKKETLAREGIQRLRYMQYYRIDVTDLSIYDLKIDTGLHSIDFTGRHIVDAVRSLLQEQNTSEVAS